MLLDGRFDGRSCLDGGFVSNDRNGDEFNYLSAFQCFRDLNFLSRDSLGVVIDQLVIIAVDKYQKLTDVSRSQLVWVVR